MLTAAEFLEEARRTTGLSDFGEDSFREGLEILLDSIRDEADLNATGEGFNHGAILMHLVNRLQIEDWYRRHPEIDDQEITAPLVILGLPRTGSTLFHCLLAQDPENRFPRYWEAEAPCPPPESATEDADPRIARSAASIAMTDQMAPRLKSMLPWSATEATEDQNFMAMSFKSHILQAYARVPHYTRWLHYEADMQPACDYLKRVLKLLQWRCPPRRWTIKMPSHIFYLEELLHTFPDARFVMTHRDVANVIPSVSDMYMELQQAGTNSPDPIAIGSMHSAIWREGMKRMIAFRDAGNDMLFHDVSFDAVQKARFAEVSRLYDWLGWGYTAEAESRMRAWTDATPRDKHGAHDYHPERFGLDLAQLRSDFRFYSDIYQTNMNENSDRIRGLRP